MSVQGSNLRPGILKTYGPFETSSHLALTQIIARLQKDYMLSGKEVYCCNE
jgi:hypothetical protein